MPLLPLKAYLLGFFFCFLYLDPSYNNASDQYPQSPPHKRPSCKVKLKVVSQQEEIRGRQQCLPSENKLESPKQNLSTFWSESLDEEQNFQDT